MDNKKRTNSFQKQRRTQQNHFWKDIQRFVVEICEKNVDKLDVYYEEEKNLSQFAIDRSPTKNKQHFTIKSFLNDQFALIAKQQGYNLNEQIIKSFKAAQINQDQVNEQKEIDEAQVDQKEKQTFIQDSMIHLGTNSACLHFSDDNKFVLKGIPISQFNTFKQNFKSVFQEKVFNLNNSLSVKILGLFEIQDQQDQWIGRLELPSNYFILMENILAEWNFNRNTLLSIYDLKGSTFGREVNSDSAESSDNEIDYKDSPDNKSRQSINSNQSRQQYDIHFGKDNNFKENKKDKEILYSLPTNLKKELLEQIKQECKQFEQADIMDYSLMIVIGKQDEDSDVQNQTQENENKVQQQNKFKNIQHGEYIISFGLIDYLTEYDFKKSLESTFKSIFCSDKDSISCVDPETYYERILKYVKKQVLSIESND